MDDINPDKLINVIKKYQEQYIANRLQMSHFQTQSDSMFFNKLYQSMRGIFTMQRQQWSCEQILRFLALIKVESRLETIFYEFRINGELLFNVKYLWEQMGKYLQDKTYFPIMKLLYIIVKLNLMENRTPQHVKFVRSHSDTQTRRHSNKEDKQRSSDKKIQNDPNDQQPEQQLIDSSMRYINVKGDIIQALDNQFKKLGEVIIADLSSNQLAKIFRSTQHPRALQLSQLIRNYSIDGYCVVCLLTEKESLLTGISEFFSKEQLNDFDEILNIILPFYYKQLYDPDQRKNSTVSGEINFAFFQLKQKQSPQTQQDYMKNSKASFGTSQMGTSQMGTSQMGTSEMGTSEIFGESQAGSDASVEYGVSQQNNGSQYARKSSMGRSEYANSVYGKSEYGKSQYGTSNYATSEVGSVRGSMTDSVMGQSVVYEHDHKEKHKNVRISSVQDAGIANKLKQVALSLPFNLFKMEPLQNIMLTTLNYPFTLNFPKPKSHQEFVRSLKQSIEKVKQCTSNTGVCSNDFNITGVKFGRSPQNDYRYPDELSISAKHAQIGFWNNKYQLVDLQSKTGTFLYIPLTKPLTLKDQHIIQLSNQIEIVVHILKKEPNEGTIKLQFTKPQNEPFYKATLRQNQTLKIGRSQKSHIKLSQQSISSKHTQIKYENQEFKLYDCLSSTGTWLRLSKKGVKSETFPIEQGDIIRISSKKTYLIEKMTYSFEDDEEMDEFQELLENPNFKVVRENSDDNFNKIIENTWKRKTPYEKKKQVHFEAQLIQ